MLSRSALVLCLLSAVACTPHAPPSVPATWASVRDRDSRFEYRLPPQSTPVGDSACWNLPSRRSNPGSLICLDEMEQDTAALQVGWRFRPCSTGFADAACYTEATGDTVAIDGQPLLRVRALLSGTFGHFKNQPTVLFVIPLPQHRSVLFETYLMDPADSAAILRVAGSVRAL